jgi:adhesin transport system outer membrane protein
MLRILYILVIISLALTAQDKEVPDKAVKAADDGVLSGTLKDIVLSSVDEHPQIKKLKKGREVAYEDIWVAKGQYFPSLDVRAAYGREGSRNQTVENRGRAQAHLWRRENSATLTQLLFDGGEVGSQVDRNKALHARTHKSIADAKESFALRTVEAFVDLKRVRAQIGLSVRNIEAHKEILDVVEKRFKNKLVPEADVVQVRGRLALAQAQLRREMADLKAAEARFFEITGKKPGKLTALAPIDGSLPKELKEAQNSAVTEHPAVLAGRDTIKAVEATIDQAYSKFYPKAHLELNVVDNENLRGSISNDDSRSAMVIVTWNLFNGMSDRAEVLRELSRKDQEGEALFETQRLLARDVAEAWHLRIGKIEELDFFKKHQVASEKTFEAYKSQYELGKNRTLFDLLNARSEYFRARFNVIDAEYSIKLNSHRILASMGKLILHFESQK